MSTQGCRRTARAGAVAAIVLSVLALLGWIAGIHLLATLVGGTGSMKVDTAVGMLLLGARIGTDGERLELLRRAAPLHDVGKIGIPDSILLKPGRLTPAEAEVMQTHTVIGAGMLADGGFPLLEMAEQIALSHHERWDGTGYPHGLAGDAIPIVAQIVALADVFDALTNDRPYKSAWSVADALVEIDAQRGRQFNPALADAFTAMIRADSAQATAAGLPEADRLAVLHGGLA